MSVVAQEAIDYIKARKEHSIESLKTRWNKLNNVCMGGIESNIVMTVTGISASGKSSFINELQTDLIDLNPDKDIFILNFSFEMVGFRQVGRTLSNKLRKTTSELYSSYVDLDDKTFGEIVNVSNQLKKYQIYFVDDPGTPSEIGNLQQAAQKLYFSPPEESIVEVSKYIDITTDGSKKWAEKLTKLTKGYCVTAGYMVRNNKIDKYDPKIIKITSLEDRVNE